MTSEVLNKTYNSVSDEIDALNIPMKRKAFVWAISILTSALVVAGPIALLINLMIFNDYQRLFLFLIGILGIIFAFLADFLYLRTITKGEIQGLYHIWSIDVIIISIVVFIVVYVVMEIGVL